MRAAGLRAALVFFGVIAGSSPVAGQVPVQERLDSLQVEITETSSKIDAATIRQRELEAAMKEVRTTVGAVRAERASLTKKLQELAAAETVAARDLRILEEQTLELKKIARARIRALYREDRSGGMLTMLATDSSARFARFVVYAQRFQRFDAGLKEKIVAKEAELNAERLDLQKAQAERQRTAQQLLLTEERLQTQSSEYQKLLAEQKAERITLETNLVGLRAQVLRLETVLLSLTGGAPSEYQAPSAPQSEPAAGAKGYQPFRANGLFARGSQAIRPVKGKVVRRYGRYKPSKLRDVVMNKGTEFLAPVEEGVQAIATGRVLYAGRMPVFGLVVVLDHGERSYSLYGRLATTARSVGEDLQQGEIVGTLGAPEDGEAGNFYFEVRKEGVSVDPAKVLKKL